MTLFLLLILIAIVLGLIGVVAASLGYLLVIGVIVFLAAFVYLGLRVRHNARRPPR
ncbi:hypothetical protein [Streptomyces palmae]|uniref:hypothetical protein n=1 Tax=Streptomyces palmae TaxID=1701085 RepID=UPI001432D5BA|nr:hypothetical protein [Streptomyces palmae]